MIVGPDRTFAFYSLEGGARLDAGAVGVGMPLPGVAHLARRTGLNGLELASKARTPPDERMFVLGAVGRRRQNVHQVKVRARDVEVAEEHTTRFLREPRLAERSDAVQQVVVQDNGPAVALRAERPERGTSTRFTLPSGACCQTAATASAPAVRTAREGRSRAQRRPAQSARSPRGSPRCTGHTHRDEYAGQGARHEGRPVVLGLECIQAERPRGILHQHHRVAPVRTQKQRRAPCGALQIAAEVARRRYGRGRVEIRSAPRRAPSMSSS